MEAQLGSMMEAQLGYGLVQSSEGTMGMSSDGDLVSPPLVWTMARTMEGDSVPPLVRFAPLAPCLVPPLGSTMVRTMDGHLVQPLVRFVPLAHYLVPPLGSTMARLMDGDSVPPLERTKVRSMAAYLVVSQRPPGKQLLTHCTWLP